jgi:hypothetical protein
MNIQLGPTYSSKTQKNKIKPINLSQLFKLDSPLFFLLLSNIVTICFAVYENWSLMTVLWIYWFQSVFIGLFNFIKIMNLRNFTTDNFEINHRPVEPTNATKRFTAFFFLFHYGFFHFVYMIFLLENDNVPFGLILIPCIFFFVNHLFSFAKNFENDANKKQNIGTAMFFPYARIIPMHLIIVFGLAFTGSISALLIFLILKTIADLIMHQIEHTQNGEQQI